jgi:hypothetical protein
VTPEFMLIVIIAKQLVIGPQYFDTARSCSQAAMIVAPLTVQPFEAYCYDGNGKVVTKEER